MSSLSRAYTTFYSAFKETTRLPLYRFQNIASHLSKIASKNFSTPRVFDAHFGGDPIGISSRSLAYENGNP